MDFATFEVQRVHILRADPGTSRRSLRGAMPRLQERDERVWQRGRRAHRFCRRAVPARDRGLESVSRQSPGTRGAAAVAPAFGWRPLHVLCGLGVQVPIGLARAD